MQQSGRIRLYPKTIRTVCRRLLKGVAVAVLFGYVMQASATASANASLAAVIDQAKQLAADDYQAISHPMAAELVNMSYEQYRAIQFNPQHALWRDQSDYEIQFFHPGFLYRQPVQIMQVNAKGEAETIGFDSARFIYHPESQSLQNVVDEQAGYAGFRVHFPLNSQQHKEEFTVFLGASYFRLVGAGQLYGLSARGLAIDTAEASGEEFPYFKRFWLHPAKQGQPLVIDALLDSPSLSGAYRFILQPGESTTMQVEAHIFARKAIKKLGIAPLTSMYLYGENSQRHPDDFRPEVHDSDGLLMHASNGEWIWRPLTNPQQLQVTSLLDSNPQGFGLLQRDLAFGSYLDSEANYHKRPGLWVKPLENWGKGRVELVEIPTDTETNDNIVAYWVNQQSMAAGEQRVYRYELSTIAGNLADAGAGHVVRTRQGSPVLPGVKRPANNKLIERRFAVDFDSKGISEVALKHELEADIQLSNGHLSELKVMPVNDGQQYRVTFVLVVENQQAVDMRLFIKANQQRVSEVWNYVWKNHGNA